MSKSLNTPSTTTAFTPAEPTFNPVVGSNRPSEIGPTKADMTPMYEMVPGCLGAAVEGGNFPDEDTLRRIRTCLSSLIPDAWAPRNFSCGFPTSRLISRYYGGINSDGAVSSSRRLSHLLGLKVDTSCSWLNDGLEVKADNNAAKYGYEDEYTDNANAFADFASSSPSPTLSTLVLPNPFSPSYVSSTGANAAMSDRDGLSAYSPSPSSSPIDNEHSVGSPDFSEIEELLDAVIEPVAPRFLPNGSLASLAGILGIFN